MTAKTIIPAASEYTYVNDLCIITCYFNPRKYQSKRKNFEAFIAPINKAGLNYIVVECAFNNSDFEIPESSHVIHVTSNAILWQKERLLNIALKAVPPACSKIVWIDCDILFSNKNWASHTSQLLDHYPVVQPYKNVIRLPKNSTAFSGEGLVYNGFAAIYKKYPNALLFGNFELHGHTGFVWAARKEVFDGIGFYDTCLSGVADHLMAHSFCGDWHSACLQKMFLENHKYFGHFEQWCKKVYERIKGRLGYTEGVVLHLWHGNHIDRAYLENSQFLSQTPFNPPDDLFLNESNCWEIKENRDILVDWTQLYLTQRKED